MNCYDYPESVQYPDLGEDNRLSPAGALRMMQEGSARASAARGFGPEDTVRLGLAWALVGWKLRLLRRPAWAEPLLVHTWPRAMDGHVSDRDFLLLDQAGERVATATSRWLLIDTATGHAAKITDEVRAIYQLDESRAVEGDAPSHLSRGPQDARRVCSYTVLRRDIDTLHHMNNLHYLELAREALPAEAADLPFENYEILYKRQIKLGETVDLCYAFEEGRHVVEFRNQDGRRVHALLWFY